MQVDRLVVVGEDDAALDHVLQLANIAWPVVLGQCAHGFRNASAQGLHPPRCRAQDLPVVDGRVVHPCAAALPLPWPRAALAR
ncbi:hypothetical protein D9M68_742490 [compost metagenome]